ncbi:MAG: 5-(carboxyamino)imidazole ribonucleotide mutase [Candidatus Aminicenantes bacterium]|nr:5-(carboxyamino)imidazole ribonucleotide mutase [Candidatus Aminicenantes bacterium]
MKVGLFIGSESDYGILQEALAVFDEFGISYLWEITSAHRSPERTKALIGKFEKEGVAVFIAVAGKAAHLAGVVASYTLKPVIGVPVGGSELGGLDALLSTVQMPRGVPVASMGLGKSGAANAALFAVHILGLSDKDLAEKLSGFRKKMVDSVKNASQKVKRQKA